MDVRTYIPHPALQGFVWSISTVRASLPGSVTEVVTPYPPTPFQSLLFYCNDPISMGRPGSDAFHSQAPSILTGPQVSRVNIKVHHRLNAIRVDFIPGGAYRLLGIPMHELFDNGYDTTEIFGAPIKRLNERLAETGDPEEGKNLVELFLLSLTGRMKEPLPFDTAISQLLSRRDVPRIDELAGLSCLSIKQFERKCRERLGMNPKIYLRILRFSSAYRLREASPAMTWTEIAHSAGYFDQMHMIRDFKEFAGVNPSVIERQLLQTPLRMQRDLTA